MFNAANILEALKNYIRTRGGTSNAYNIAEAVNDLNSIPQGSGGDIPNEVTNAVETHGMGWTESESREGFDIQWDGNTEGLESFVKLFKVSEDLFGINSPSSLIGSTLVRLLDGESFSIEIDEDAVSFITDSIIAIGDVASIVLKDTSFNDRPISKGIWFTRNTETEYISRLYKEASTQEVVHQIDQKYIPSSGVIIETASNTTVGAYQAPNPTAEQVTAAYNAVVSAKPCTLTDALGKQHFVVNQADIVGDAISISILYYMKMIITYSVENDEVIITHYDIGSAE